MKEKNGLQRIRVKNKTLKNTNMWGRVGVGVAGGGGEVESRAKRDRKRLFQVGEPGE